MSTEATDSRPYWKQPGYDISEDINAYWDYFPSRSMGIAFVVLFSLSTIAHIIQLGISKRPWCLVIVAGCLGEVIGWSGRLWASIDTGIFSYEAFMLQIVCLVICPAFFSAAVYAILGWIISSLDPRLSLLKPRLYWRIFIAGDIFSLVIQSVGGAIAAGSDDDRDQADLGSGIMLGGIAVQFAVTVIFAGLFLHFLRNVRKSGIVVDRRLRWIIYGNLAATSMVILRGIYRLVELAQGWSGYLITHEPYFLLDSLPMLFLVIILNITHPAHCLPRPARWMATGFVDAKGERSEKEATADEETGNSRGSSGVMLNPPKDSA